MQKRRARRSPLPLILSLLTALIVVLIAGFFYESRSGSVKKMDAAAYYGLTADTEVPLIVDDKILESRGLIEDGETYLDYQTVWSGFNSGFYWEAASSQLLLTLPDGVQSYRADDGSGVLRMIGETPYIKASFVKENSDIDMEILENPTRIVARTSWYNLAAERVTSNTYVRSTASQKGKVLTEVRKGDIVVLLKNTDHWCQVSTADGFLGYVQKSRLEEAGKGALTHKSPDRFAFHKISLDYKISLAWMYVDSEDDNEAFASLVAEAKGLNTISPTWFTFQNEAGDLHSLASADLVAEAHKRDIQVWGALQDVFGGQVQTGDILSTREVRSHVIDQLLDVCSETGMDGINVDIETIAEEDAPQYLQFLKELCVEAHKQGIIISTDNYVPGYTSYYERGEQARTVDYIIIMGYDEHTTSSEEAGSVASLDYVKKGIEETLKEVPAGQVINALPFYTRGWTEYFGQNQLNSEAFGMKEADEFVRNHGISLTWDGAVGQNVGTVESDQARYSIWMEDERSIREKLKLMEGYDLAGVAAWRLGFERADVWEEINAYLQKE